MDITKKRECVRKTENSCADDNLTTNKFPELSSSPDFVRKTPVKVNRYRKFNNLSLRNKETHQGCSSHNKTKVNYTNCDEENDEKCKRLREPTTLTPSADKKKPKVTTMKETLNEHTDADVISLEDTLNYVEPTQVLIKKSKKKSDNLPVEVNNEDTLNYVESTQLLIKNAKKKTENLTVKITRSSSSSNKEISKVEENGNSEIDFDAFKSYFCTQIQKKEEGEKDLSSTDNELSQSFLNTQALKQIDSVISDSSKIEPEVDESDHTMQTKNEAHSIVGPETSFKIPVVTPSKPVKKNKQLCPQSQTLAKNNGKSNSVEDLFNTDLLTTQCRKEVDMIFERLETSVFLMGTNEAVDRRKLPDEVFDIIFCPDKNTEELATDDILTQTKTAYDKSIANIDWSNETLLNATGINSSFGTIFKQALEANATKPVTVDKSVNKSFVEPSVAFISAGPFYGLPIKVKELIKHYKGIEELYNWQDECLKLPAIEKRKNLIYALPTSGGKTLVAEILMLREIICYKRNALFILPYVAIVQEKVWALSPFAVALDFLVEEYAASKGTYPPRKRRRKNSVYIATIEKALGLINSLIETERMDELGLIVVDELHLVGEPGRGATLEALLTKLIYLKANVQIVGMSATIGNIDDIKHFLNADVYTQNFRPVELTEYIKCGNEVAKINWTAKCEEDLFTVVRKTDFSYSEAVSNIDPDQLGGLVMEVIPKGSCLIFCSSKKNCENVSFLLCRILFPKLKEHKKEEKQQLLHGLKDEGGSLCSVLKVSIQFGIAYHHSGLTSEERRLIEDGFRAGIISVICCTSTLAAGVNLPAQRVIIRQPYVGREFINLSRYKQMVGRAGRAGLGEAGDSIVICTSQDLPKLKNMFMSPMDRALSSMHIFNGKGLRHLLLSCISLGVAKNKTELLGVVNKTLLAVQCEALEVNIKKLTEKVICDLFKLGALQVSNITQVENEDFSPLSDVTVRLDSTSSSLDTSLSEESEPKTKKKKKLLITNNTRFVISKLGSAAIKGGLDLSRAHILYEDLIEAQRSLVLLDALHLIFLVIPYDIAEQIKPNMTIYYSLLSQMGSKERQTAKVLGLSDSVAVKMLRNQPIKNIPERVLNRFYLALMLYDLWNEKPVFEVSEKYQINRGVVQNLMTSSASFSSNVVNFCDQLEEFWAFAHLLRGMSQRLSHCCLRELLPLMELPAVKQSRAKQLYNAGYKTLQSIAKANVNDLVENIEFMSRRVANQLIAASKMLLLEKIENLREEAEDVLDGVENPKPFLNRSVY